MTIDISKDGAIAKYKELMEQTKTDTSDLMSKKITDMIALLNSRYGMSYTEIYEITDKFFNHPDSQTATN